jgi:hypothetical protein
MNAKIGILIHSLLKMVGYGVGKERQVMQPHVEVVQGPLDEHSVKAILALSFAAQEGLQVQPLSELIKGSTKK